MRYSDWLSSTAQQGSIQPEPGRKVVELEVRSDIYRRDEIGAEQE